MPKTTVSLSQFTLDETVYLTALDAAIKRALKMAARAFLNVAVRAVPVRTGFARGSLQNLGDVAGVSIPITPATSFLKFAKSIHGTSFRPPMEYYHGTLKTPQSGRQFATPEDNIFQVNGMIYTFNFESWIDYFTINDENMNPRNHGTPWRAFEFGTATAVNYLQNIEIPNVLDFVVSK